MNQVVPKAVQRAAQSGPLIVVLNAGSGKTGADERTETLTRVFAAAGREAEFLPIDTPERIGAIAAQAVKRAKAVKGVVVAAGGDGTLNAFATAQGAPTLRLCCGIS